MTLRSLLLLALSLAAPAQAAELSADDVARHARTVRALAAETRLFVEEKHAGTLLPAYAAVHRDKLAESLAEPLDALAKPAAATIAEKAAQARALANALANVLSSLAGRLDDRGALEHAAAEARRIGEAVAPLGGRG